MGATGRKLTIRMPDNPGLRSAEVGKVHLDPGARVQSGNPVLTLVNRRKEHLVRAPRSGRIVPLIAPGDRVNGGDPLYILHIDELALDAQNREEREMIAVEREKWTSGVLADAIEPVRRQKVEAEPYDPPAFVANWGKPVLALALYVLACFALLPILHFFGKTASVPQLIAMVIGCIAFAALIFYLYAPESGRWPRLTVRLVAISWVGISSAALFYRPDGPSDITFDKALGPIAGLFQNSETPLAPAPEATPVPVAIVQSGVASGAIESRPSPARTEPVMVLASFDDAIAPHGVQVHVWGRVNPRNDSGERAAFDPQDREIVAPVASLPVLFASVDEAGGSAGAPVLPEGLVGSPKRVERQSDVLLAAIPRIQDADLPAAPVADARYVRDTATPSIAALIARAPSERASQDQGAIQPGEALTLGYGDAGTMTGDALPILKGEQAGPEFSAIALAGLSGFDTRFSRTASRGAVSGQPEQARSPAINLMSSLRSGDTDWAMDQMAALGSPVTSLAAQAPAAGRALVAVRNAELPSADPSATPIGEQDVPTSPVAQGQIAFGVASPATPEATGADALALDAPFASAVPGFDARFSRTASRGFASAQPDQARSPAINLMSSLRTGDADWAMDQMAALDSPSPSVVAQAPAAGSALVAVRNAALLSEDPAATPIVEEDVPTPPIAEGQIAFGVASPVAPEATGSDALALDARSAPALTGFEPARVATSRSPGLLLISALRAGEAGWMLDQTKILANDVIERDAASALFTRTQSPVTMASLNDSQIAGVPRVSALSDRIGVAKDFGMAVLPVLDGEPSAPDSGQDERAEIQIARLSPLNAFDAPSGIGSSVLPGRAPRVPPVQPEITLAQRDLLYLYFDDPRILSHPQLGDPWEGLTSPELASAIERTEVVAVQEMLQVQNWCAAANDPDGTKRAELGAQYTTAFINDRIRLLRVRLSVDEAKLALLESEIPLFGGTPAGFFHNKAPMLGGQPEDSLMQTGRDYLRSLSTGIFDPNAPDAIGGGQYFDNAIAVSVILRGAGCDQASLNDGAGPTNEIGRVLNLRLGG